MDDDKLGGITEVGKELFKRAIENYHKVLFSHVQFGSGQYQVRPGVPIRATKLVDPVFNNAFSEIYFDAGAGDCELCFTVKFIPSLIPRSFWLNEIGIFARLPNDIDNTLIYYKAVIPSWFIEQNASQVFCFPAQFNFGSIDNKKPPEGGD